MDGGFHPSKVEHWYSWWEEQGLFHAECDSTCDPFVMLLPPPNVTGTLHLGHALTCSIQDAMARWQRMKGRPVVWVPGTDHAGIATQTIVEKQLAMEGGGSRRDLGREDFLNCVHDWVDVHGGKINNQLRRLGASLDWQRSFFTMDETRAAAVQAAFIKLFNDGLVYRESRIVNWCPKLQTVVSDIEVEHMEVQPNSYISIPGYPSRVKFGVLTSFAYRLEDGGGEVVVATTRLETMLGDTGIAVHPADDRYADLVGRRVVHPIDGRLIPIVADSVVDPTFGSGAVKLTPAHDADDYATAMRHGLERLTVIDDHGNIIHGMSEFHGLPRFVARGVLRAALEAKGLLRGDEDHAMRLAVCSRSGDVLEPMLKPQWWVRCGDMALKAAQAVTRGDVTIEPHEHRATFLRWMDQCRDWCVSRQLWWGHRIPAYRVLVNGSDSGQWEVASSAAQAVMQAEAKDAGNLGSITVVQDEDVLDTWFSSALLPFAAFGEEDGWAFPNSVVETGEDIIFFWVARMIMLGIQIAGQVPFPRVILHPLIRDAQGRKMSKSLGNVIDPMDVMDGITFDKMRDKLTTSLTALDKQELRRALANLKTSYPRGIAACGADALRMALLGSGSTLNVATVDARRRWCNKLWNAVRFTLIVCEGTPPQPPKEQPFASIWILHRLNLTVETVNSAMERCDFQLVVNTLHSFWQRDLCDVFIELAKKDAALVCALVQCVETGLRLLHPIMPFITEELWQRVRSLVDPTTDSIMVAPYPLPNAAHSCPEADKVMQAVLELVTAARRELEHVTALESATLRIECGQCIRDRVSEIKALTRVGSVVTVPSALDEYGWLVTHI